MLAAADGNVSLRVEEGLLITPSGLPKAFIEPKDMALVTLDNQILHGNPSSERLMHLAVYNHSEKAQAVVHAHPPTAISWTVAFPEYKELPNSCLSEIILAAGRIPIVEYARPGTESMGDVLKKYIDQHKILILSRHGGLAWGESMSEAYMGMERLEHSSEILYKAKILDGLTELDDDEMEELYKIRQQIGNRTL